MIRRVAAETNAHVVIRLAIHDHLRGDFHVGHAEVLQLLFPVLVFELQEYRANDVGIVQVPIGIGCHIVLESVVSRAWPARPSPPKGPPPAGPPPGGPPRPRRFPARAPNRQDHQSPFAARRTAESRTTKAHDRRPADQNPDPKAHVAARRTTNPGPPKPISSPGGPPNPGPPKPMSPPGGPPKPGPPKPGRRPEDHRTRDRQSPVAAESRQARGHRASTGSP